MLSGVSISHIHGCVKDLMPIIMRFVHSHKYGGVVLFNYDRFNDLVKQTGVKKAHICRVLIKSPYYLRDAEKTKADLDDETVVAIANILHTTPAYLRGETDDNKPHESKSHEIGHDLKFALFGTDDIDDSVFEEVKRFAQFAKERYEQERGIK